MVHVIEHDYVDKMPGSQVGGYDRPIGRIRYFDILGEPVSLRAAEYLRKVQPVARAEIDDVIETGGLTLAIDYVGLFPNVGIGTLGPKVIILPALHEIASGAAANGVVTAIAVDPIIAVLAEDPIVAAAAKDPVVARAAKNRIVVVTAVELIVARAAIEDVSSRRARKRIVA